MMQKTVLQISLLVVLLGMVGCADVTRLVETLGIEGAAGSVSAPVDPGDEVLPLQAAGTPEALDLSTKAEREKAAQVSGTGRFLGQTVAALGSPAEPGFWLKTPLVSVDTEGQVTDPATGLSVAVTLIAIDGPATAGSRLSLSAMRVLEVSLADLVKVDVSI